MKKIFPLLFLATITLGGCFWDVFEMGCEFVDDEGHCYQAVAVQESDPEGCANVTSDFTNSNPPKDKCHLMIAKNTGDPSICDNIVGGPGSYTREDCIIGVLENNTPDECVNAADETACRTAYALNGGSCGQGFTYKDEQCQLRNDSEEEDTEGGLSNAEKADIQSVVDAATGKYMDFLEQDIELETDPARLAGLEAYRDFLQESGKTMEQAQTTFDQLSEVRRIFLDTYDDSMSIENMDVAAELDPGYYDQMRERLFGADEPLTGINKENADAESALQIYETMLTQQSENEFLQKDKLNRLGEVVSSKFRDEVTGMVVDGAKELAESAAGTAFGAVTQVGDALEAFKSEAKKQTFLGLARAYNRRRASIESGNSNLTPREAHEMAVQQVKKEPYRDNTNTGVIKHGNLLQNDCGSYNGELCVSFDVWWTAMDKTYKYNKKKGR